MFDITVHVILEVICNDAVKNEVKINIDETPTKFLLFQNIIFC